MIQLKTINKENLEVGDVVGYPIDVQVGWHNFRYNEIVPDVVKRITPARTKITLESGRIITRSDKLYEYDEVAKKQSLIAKAVKDICENIYFLNKNKEQIRLIDDDDLLQIKESMDNTIALIEKAIGQQ